MSSEPTLRAITAAEWAEMIAATVPPPPGTAKASRVTVHVGLEPAAFDALEVGGREGWSLWSEMMEDPDIGPYKAQIWSFRRAGGARVDLHRSRETS